MKKLKLFPLLITSLLGVTTLTGCAIDLFEDELNVVFMNEGQIVDNGVITQYKNFRTPELDEAYVPTDYRFLGWTAYDYSELDLQDATHFKTQYIMAGRMVHYMEAKPFAVNRTTVYTALILHKDEIPKDYHYAVIAWYDKESTTGINSGEMKTLINKTKDYLKTISPKKIVYVSCDPVTLARDLKDLSDKYSVKDISLVNMFPRTEHIETIVKLEKDNKY